MSAAESLHRLWVDLQAQVEFEALMRAMTGEHLIDVTFVDRIDGEIVEWDALYLETNGG